MAEFENLLGREVAPDEYEKIETVYMQFDYDQMSKEKIVELYKNDSSFVTDTLYGYIARNEAENAERLKGINNMQKRIDKLSKENEQLQVENDLLKDIAVKYQVEDYKNKNHIEELETQLHQYKALFAELEKNATVSLYKTLLGVMK